MTININTESVDTYEPERDAPKDHELNKNLFEPIIPRSTFQFVNQYIDENLYQKLEVPGGLMWDRLLANFPVLFRILTYIYSPPDDFETRMKMLALWIKADESRNDLRTPQIIHELNHCWSLFNHPEISEYSIISDFLQNLNSDFDSVFINDLRKVGGEESTIQNLRDTWIITEENENRKKNNI